MITKKFHDSNFCGSVVLEFVATTNFSAAIDDKVYIMIFLHFQTTGKPAEQTKVCFEEFLKWINFKQN